MVINMSEYNNVPKIRFKGFTDVWEQRKLGDVSFFKQGSQVDLDKQYSDLNENRVRFIRIVDYTQNTDDIRYIDKELSNNIINEKDVVIVRYGATAGFVGHGITGVLANNMFTVNPENDVAKDYLYIYLKQDKIYKKLNNSNGSSAMPALNFGTVKDVGIAYPLVAEQEKIGELFTNLDNLITLHQRKCDNLINVKKSLLEKMFPKNSSNIPEIRFKGFTDVWEQRKLEEISNRFDNLRVPVSANEREKGTTPYYGANGIQDYVKGFTHNGEYVLIAEDGANDLKNYPVKYVNGLFWANNHVHVVQGKEGICDNKYLKYCFTKTNIESLLVGGGRAKLNANIMMGIELTVPSFKEQVELGRMFYELDNLITLHQRKLEKLKNIKKSMLDKMFV